MTDGGRSGEPEPNEPEPGGPEQGDPEVIPAAMEAFDLGSVMQMAEDMTQRMSSAQAELAEARAEGTAGGGLVKVVLNGHLHMISVAVDADAVDPDDASMVGDLILAAWRDAHEQVARLQSEADPLGGLGGDLTGGLGGLLGGG